MAEAGTVGSGKPRHSYLAANTAFAEIKMLTERAGELSVARGADGHGNRDVQLKQAVPFTGKLKGFSPTQILRLYNKVVEFMAENSTQPGLVASEIVTTFVKETIMAENRIGTIAFSQMTAMDCFHFINKEAAAQTETQWINLMEEITHWPAQTGRLVAFSMSEVELIGANLNLFVKSFADASEICGWDTAAEYTPKMGGGKTDLPNFWRTMIPCGLGGVLHRQLVKDQQHYDLNKKDMGTYAEDIVATFRVHFLEPYRKHTRAAEMLAAGLGFSERRDYDRKYRPGQSGRYSEDRSSSYARRGDRPSPTDWQRSRSAPSTAHTINDSYDMHATYESDVYDDDEEYAPHMVGDDDDSDDGYDDAEDGVVGNTKSNRDLYPRDWQAEDSMALTPTDQQPCNYHCKGDCHFPGVECQRSHATSVCQPATTSNLCALLHGPYAPRGWLEVLQKNGFSVPKPPTREPTRPYAGGRGTGGREHGGRGLQPPLRPLGPGVSYKGGLVQIAAR
jgi:hypothetical protein